MKVTVVGSGYVGLVSGACLADAGNEVVCLDVDAHKVAELNANRVPIHEPRLDTLIARSSKRGLLRFTTDVKMAVEHGAIQMIAVGTPPDEDGSADLGYVLKAAESIGCLMQQRTIIVTKSTVPVGTGDKVRSVVQAALDRRGVQHKFAVVSNPEFLREGDAIRDFKQPDRVVIGANEPWALSQVEKLYEPFVSTERPIISMDLRSAELTKYAANSMLATRISFMNELANLAEDLGADIEAVRIAIGADPRIGPLFLRAGCGYGGSCFPKDVSALIHTAQKDAGRRLEVLNAVAQINESQKMVLVTKITKYFGDNLRGLRFALWGLAFKPDTDDMRDAPAIPIIDGLLERGAMVTVFDPVALPEAQRRLGVNRPNLRYADSATAALADADALILVTEWSEFRLVPPADIATLLSRRVVFDGRNIWDPEEMAEVGIDYFSIGRARALTALRSID
jgi:UDPglucose 6-dehydrogenase